MSSKKFEKHCPILDLPYNMPTFDNLYPPKLLTLMMLYKSCLLVQYTVKYFTFSTQSAAQGRRPEKPGSL